MITKFLQSHARETLKRALEQGWTKVDRNTYRRETGEVIERTTHGWRRRDERLVYQSVAATISSIEYARKVAQSAS